MKILELRFKNLNSLYGEWTIDFTDPEFSCGGIFALTGPTGAGKSTILDAICLALYGATPRLGRITKSGNEIMSRQTGECYAEVLFASQAGTFRVHWQQRRARKKAGGKLQDQEHQIAEADTGRLLETKKSLVVPVVIEKTGMDFDRFTRSILLAQGGFDTFLKADVEQKSKILEQITGTEIYSEISRRVHERQKKERDGLSLLRAEVSGIVSLEPKEEDELLRELAAKEKQEMGLARQMQENSKAIDWLTSIENLTKECHSLVGDAARLNEAAKTFLGKRKILEEAEKAFSVDGKYTLLSLTRKRQADEKALLGQAAAALLELQSLAKKEEANQKKAEIQIEKVKKELLVAAPLIKQARLLDQKIREGAGAVSAATKAVGLQEASLATESKSLDQLRRRQLEGQAALKAAEGYLTEHGRDEWLVGGFAGLNEQFAGLARLNQEILGQRAGRKEQEKELAEAQKRFAAARDQDLICRQKLSDASKALQQAKESLGEILGDRLLREYRQEKDSLLRERAYINRIKELKEHRQDLLDGKPCPLCGATSHPYAVGNIPTPDAVDKKIETLTIRIARAEKQEAANRALEQQEIAARNELIQAEKLAASTATLQQAAAALLAEREVGLKKSLSSLYDNQKSLEEKLTAFGIEEVLPSNLEDLRKHLADRLKRWQAERAKKEAIEKELQAISSEEQRLVAIISLQEKTLFTKEQELRQLQKDHESAMEMRHELYGKKDADQEEKRLNRAIAHAEATEKKARSVSFNASRQLMSARAKAEAIEKALRQRATVLKEREEDFLQALAGLGFNDEKTFLAASLDKERREALAVEAKALDLARTELAAKQKDRAARLAHETAKKITEKSLTELEPQQQEDEKALAALRQAMAALRHRLVENIEGKKRIEEKLAAITAQKKECHRWDQLHGLIGSADGKKFRNFAQGLTFELMVSHANRQLEKMTDRYLLIRDGQEPLELNVVDTYQAGEVRSTRNLSGGESFIVSLTLALGLSKMASRKVRVDSLFLDEGFGTLDEDSLETALETLAGLQQDGKLIGIISHVAALKERIGLQIKITPVSGGRSLLTGPGCSRLEG